MPSLSLALSPHSLQRLHDALSCIAKFSEYVTIEAARNNLCLAALNSSKSAHGAVNLLGGRFFDSYHFVPTQGRSSGPPIEDSKFQCRLHTKALLSVFRQRYLDSKDKETAIEKCELTLGGKPTRGECRILVRFICKHGVVKTYKLTYEDVDIMHAVFDKNAVANRWVMNAKLLKEHMEHFGPKAEQLDISGENGRATFTSYTEKLMDGIEILKQPLHTAVSMDTAEFEEFTVEEGLHITINLKDFKAIIHHADSLSATISAYYSDPGRPLQVQYDRDGMNCEFTLMTTGSGGKNPPQFTRVVARTVPPSTSNRQAVSATNRGPPNRNISKNRDEDLVKGPKQHIVDPKKSPGPEIPIVVMEDAQPAASGAEAELSLFFAADETMDEGGPKESDGVLGWDVDMDHTRRTGPTVTQSGQSQRQPLFRVEDDSDDAVEDDMIVGPTQHVSQVSMEPHAS
ncbi:Rad9-domain-containing protein [Terfezia claveryi]|nr:Rad9-domain-containing protein [Terfezia claveryi]